MKEGPLLEENVGEEALQWAMEAVGMTLLQSRQAEREVWLLWKEEEMPMMIPCNPTNRIH